MIEPDSGSGLVTIGTTIGEPDNQPTPPHANPPPRRRFNIQISASGNTREDLIELIRYMADEVQSKLDCMNNVMGGCGMGGWYELEDRGEQVTPESYREELKTWAANRRKA